MATAGEGETFKSALGVEGFEVFLQHHFNACMFVIMQFVFLHGNHRAAHRELLTSQHLKNCDLTATGDYVLVCKLH